MSYTRGRGQKRVFPYSWRADQIKVSNPIDKVTAHEMYGNSAKSGLPFMLDQEQEEKFVKLYQSERQQRVKEFRKIILINSELLKLTLFFQSDEAIFVEDNYGKGRRRFSDTYSGYERAMFYYKNSSIIWRKESDKLPE